MIITASIPRIEISTKIDQMFIFRKIMQLVKHGYKVLDMIRARVRKFLETNMNSSVWESVIQIRLKEQQSSVQINC